MTGAVLGVVVGVVAVAAWLGGRFAAKAAVLPRETDQKVIEETEGSITFAETDRKVIKRAVDPRKVQGKVIGPSEPDREPKCDAAAQQPASAPTSTDREQTCDAATQPASADEASSAETPIHDDRETEPKPPPRILVGARPDAGTTLRLEAPTDGWPKHIRRDFVAGRAYDIGGKTMEVERRGNEGDVLVLRARGQARLLIWETYAELVVGSRALDTLGGIVGWAREWLTWASVWLLGASLDIERPLEAADELGWSPIAVDLAADLGGWGPLLDEHQDPDRWTQQTVPIPVPAGRGQLASIQLGEKRSHPLSVYGYNKTRWAAHLGRGAGWLERMRQAGRLPGEAVWRWELRLRGEALQLRRRGRGDIVVDFRRCATLADQAAIARAWAHAFGNARSDRPNGHYRLALPADRYDENGRGFPLTRTRPIDSLWRLVQEAGGQAPIETLSQVRERKEAARAEWRRKADDVALRGLAAMVALDHRDDAQMAAHAVLHRARELVFGERWTAAHALQVAATHDLHDPELDPDPGTNPSPRSKPMNATLSLINSTDDASPALPEAAAPTWTRQPVDVVERWKSRELEHHRFSRVVRPMNADERERARASLEVCGYDREWPIVLYEGQILDGRARDELAFELWQQTKRADLIPSFVELVPDDPNLGDEAALLYLQQRLIAARTLTEGERIAAAYRLFQLYRECRAKRPALGPASDSDDRYAQRSASARAAAAVAGVSPRNLERFAFVEKHGPEALPADQAKALLDAIESGEVTPRAAERRVKVAIAKREAEAHARQLEIPIGDVVPEPAGEIVFAAPGVKLARVDALTLLRSLPDACIETVFFDGPYVLGKTGTTNKGGSRAPVSPGEWDARWRSPEHYLEEFLMPVAAELERVLAPTGEVWASGTRHVIFTVERALSSMPSYRLYQDICWQKTSPPPRLHPQSGWTDDHELLLWYRARDPKLARRDVTDAKALLGTATATWPITRPNSTEYRFGRHPTQKPERLLEVILAAHQGLVLDFCAGACTTAVAAVRRRRPVLCGDLSDEDGYLGTGRLRVAAELGGSNDADPLRELAEWLTVECHLLEPIPEPRPNTAIDEFRWALLDPEPATHASPTLAHAIRRTVEDTRLLALALGIVTVGPLEFAASWAEALARLADESGDEYRSAGPAHAFAEARDYLIGFCSELGIYELDDARTDAWLAGEALAGVLRQEWSSPMSDRVQRCDRGRKHNLSDDTSDRDRI